MQARSFGFAAALAISVGIGSAGIGASTAPAGAADLPAPILKAPPPAGGAFWFSAEALAWASKGDHLPPLVTTSPAGTPRVQAGVLGQPGTAVLFGNDDVNDRFRAGARVRAGYWFDPQRTRGIELDAFMLDRSATKVALSSGAFPILAQPFTDAVSGAQNAALVAFPGSFSGLVAIDDTSRLFGAGAAYRTEFCRACGFGSVSGIVGYRYLRLRDQLAMSGTVVPAPGGVFAPGTTISTTDRFATSNDFHGLDLGLTGEFGSGPWRLTWTAKAAFGGTFTDLDISGATTTVVPGAGTTVFAGGTYAQPTSIGSYNKNRFAVVPELAANVSYQVTDRLRAFAGYSFLYWSSVIRPGNAIDTTINVSQTAGLPLVGPARPLARFDTSDYWVHGANVGLAYEF
jgi:hypothetical protein